MAVWGLDIGRSALKAVKLRSTGDGIEILAVEHIPYPIEEDEDDQQEAKAEALTSFLENQRIGSDQVVVGLAGLHAFSRFIKLPPVDASQVEKLVRLEAQQQIPFPIAEVNWDFVRVNEREGEEVEVGIFATRSELVDGFLSDLREGGVNPDIVTIAPLAIYNFVRTSYPNQSGGTIVLDIGAEHTDLVIVDGDRFWIRNLRIAGNDITKALAERFKVPFKQAEKLKRSSSKSSQAKKIFSSMQGVLKDFVGEIHRSVGFFKSQADDLEIKRVLLLGDGAKLKNLGPFLKEQLQLKVSKASQLEDMFILDGEVDVDTLDKHLMGFAVSIGLALQGAGEAPCTVDLSPQDVQINRELKNKLPWGVGAAVISWLAFGISYFHASNMQARVDEASTQANKVSLVQNVQNEAAGLTDLSVFQQQAKSYTALGGGRVFLLELLEAMREILPKDNDAVIDWDHRASSAEELVPQVRRYASKLRDSGVDDGKLWLLEMDVKRKKDDEHPERHEVRIVVAKKVPDSKRAEYQQMRDVIITEFGKPLAKALSKAPFHVRRAVGDGYTWGEVDPGKGEPLGGLAQTQTANVDNGSMFSYMLEFKFEVGVPEPPPPPPPSEEGTEEEQQ
ncbi:MAG: type IV pilus assembly protein PilM [Planctomycetes bacterium]|nr:type IV pilus assembly protein PilM [Planctomycetota bacterium]